MAKRIFFFAVAIAIVSVSASVQAQTNPQNPQDPQNVTGQTGTVWSGTSGTNSNGAQTFGSGGSGFQASDPSLASGISATSGAGTAKQTVTPTTGTSTAKAVLTTVVNANGAQTQIGLNGGAGQTTFNNIGDNLNYANGGEGTMGSFTGSLSNNGPSQGQGSVDASGQTLAKTNGAGTNNSSALVQTGGQSTAKAIFTPATGVTPECTKPTAPGSVTVAGSDGANLQSIAGNPNGNIFAGGYGNGSGSYQMTAPTTATGSVAINGATNGKIATTGPASAPTSVTVGASSTLQSIAQASGH